MKHPFMPFLDSQGVVILDGAMATELEHRGADLDDPLWSAKALLESPQLIRDVHRDYFLAGADVATTSSYQATLPGLVRRGLSEQEARDLIRLSVELASEARTAFWRRPENRAGRLRPLIAGSVGCYGAYLADGSEYRGEYSLSKENLVDFHRPRVEILADAGVDVLACETIPCLIEAEALVEVLRDFPDTPAWLSFSCRDESHVREGQLLAECVALAEGAENVVAIGVNCTAPRHVPGLIRTLSESTDILIVAYPNSGESWDAKGQCWCEDSDFADLAEPAREWHKLGARLVGGCCRTTPDDIWAMAGALRRDGAAEQPG